MRETKTIWKITLALVLALSGIGLSGCSKTDYESDSKAYIDKVAPVVFKDWDENLIMADADQDLRNYYMSNKETFEKGLQSFKNALGSMKAYKGATAVGKPNEMPDKSVIAAYSVEADFENGTSKILVTTTLRDGKWQLGLFNLDPQAEMRRIMKIPAPKS